MANRNKTVSKKHTGIICPYCQSPARIVLADEIFGVESSRGQELYVCSNYPECDAYVRVYKTKRSNGPLGTLANASLRKMRSEVHRWLDSLCREGAMSKGDVYLWLSNEMLLPLQRTHVALFDMAQCILAIEKCKVKLRELRRHVA